MTMTIALMGCSGKSHGPKNAPCRPTLTNLLGDICFSICKYSLTPTAGIW